MTPEEIRELREKHQNDGHDCCTFCTDGYVWAAPYPCDAIKVLDAFAPVDENTCEHPDFTFWRHWHVGLIRKCVKCGKEW